MSKFPENSQYRISADFSKRMTEIMEDNDFSTNKEFAKFLNINITTLSRAMTFGIFPSTRTIIKIADKLELSIKYLIGIEDKNEFIPSANPTTFYERLEELTKQEKNIKYGTLGSKTSIHRTYIYEWIRDKTMPSLDYLFEIADYYKVSPDYLLGRTDYRI